MNTATQKQIDLLNKLEINLHIKYDGLYDYGSVDCFIRENIKQYNEIYYGDNFDDGLYDLIDEQF